MYKNEGRKPHQCFHKSRGNNVECLYVCVSRMSPPVKREWFVFIISTLQSYPNCAAAGFIIMYPGRPVGVTSGGEGGI